MKKNIISLIIAGICVTSYTGIPTEIVDDLTGRGEEIRDIVGDVPADGKELTEKVVALIGDPQDNFTSAMRGFEDVASRYTGVSHHGNYDDAVALLDWKHVRDIVYDSYGSIPEDTTKE